MWMDLSGQLAEDSTYGDEKLKTARSYFAYRVENSTMGYGKHAPMFIMLVTVENLINAGFQNWDKLILRSPDEQHKMATLYKSEKRDEMVKEGYRIRGNSGDQWSDLLGSSISQRSFKLPNPMYYIP
ncbi:hypothetical protein F2Q68_00036209 [Brassica cretica]|uniref:Acid phosphatase n=1 Tax=Brassica cretica TaxID=69181 RepID=A0A8S9H137_BRACR|nr:hypothetical protein F2Q68_00036209 [Brassica cretica]